MRIKRDFLLQIRVAWFNLILCLLRRRHALLSDKASKLVPAIVNALEETDASVAGPVWDCLACYLNVNADVSVPYLRLSNLGITIATFQEFWQNCNLRKAFLPKLVSMIRKAFNGCARAISDSVTVAILKLPSDDDTPDVYGKLLAAFHAG